MMEIARSSATPFGGSLPKGSGEAIKTTATSKETVANAPTAGESPQTLSIAAGDDASDTANGITGLTEELYRLRTHWVAASHAGKNAIVALPRPDVIAAYHRNDAPHVAAWGSAVDPNAPTAVDSVA